MQVHNSLKNWKPGSFTPPPVKIKHKTYYRYFPANTKSSEMERVIEEVLQEYFAHHSDIGDTEKSAGTATG